MKCMKKLLVFLIVLLLCRGQAAAAELPEELLDSLPDSAADIGAEEGWSAGISNLLSLVQERFFSLLREGVGGIVQLLLVLFLCGIAETLFFSAKGKHTFNYVALTATAAVVLVSAGDLSHLMGLGRETIGEMEAFSKVLLPTMAAATASMGMAGAASVRQVTTVFFCDLLISLINRLILPLIYLYIGALAAGSMLGDSRLDGIAMGIKKAVVWVLSGLLTIFTLYLSVAGAVWGTVDGAAVKVTKKAIAGVVPVVGNIISGAAETVLAGAGVLKNSIGVFGVLAVLSICVLPFLKLGVQYLLYKAAAFAASTVSSPSLVKLIDGLGGAFGLLLGTVASCALLLLVSLISSLMVVAV